MTIKKKQEPFAWPPRCLLNFYVTERHCVILSHSSTYRMVDIDDIIRQMIGKSGTIYFGLSCKSKRWPIWDEERLQHIEWLISYDIEFDGEFRVSIKRDTTVLNSPCTEEYLWKLFIKRL